MTLDMLPVGSSAVITRVGGEGALRCRLLDMGLIPKTRVTVTKAAPLRDPIELPVETFRTTSADQPPPKALAAAPGASPNGRAELGQLGR